MATLVIAAVFFGCSKPQRAPQKSTTESTKKRESKETKETKETMETSETRETTKTQPSQKTDNIDKSPSTDVTTLTKDTTSPLKNAVPIAKNSKTKPRNSGKTPSNRAIAADVLNDGKGCPKGTVMKEMKNKKDTYPYYVWCERPDGVRHGPYSYNQGINTKSISQRGFYKNGLKTGRWISWSHGGDFGRQRRKWAEGYYVKGKRTKKWTWWWHFDLSKTHQKQCQGFFRKGKPVGRWKIWDASGKRIRKRFAYAIKELGVRLERYVNAAGIEGFQVVLNLFRALTPAERKRIRTKSFHDQIKSNIATTGAGISLKDAKRILAAAGYPAKKRTFKGLSGK